MKSRDGVEIEKTQNLKVLTDGNFNITIDLDKKLGEGATSTVYPGKLHVGAYNH